MSSLHRSSCSLLAIALALAIAPCPLAAAPSPQAARSSPADSGASSGSPDDAPDADAASGSSAAAAAQAGAERDDAVLDPAQPDFTIVNLPTTLRVPRFKSAFRVTHRFTRPLGQGDFGSLVEDLFGLDGGAQIGLEYRFGLWTGWQIGVHRTSDRTIQLFTQYGAVRQGDSPVAIDAFLSIDGTNNFRDSYRPAIGAIVSRTIGRTAALYATPIWVNNTNELPDELADDNNTFMVGLGARLRIRPTVYLVGEIIPRVAGFDPGVTHGTFGIEKRAGGHAFQLNFSNSFGTTMGQIARGGLSNDDWYLGFNISRKFF